MITFVLLAAFALIAVFLGIVAYSSNNRKRAGQSGRVAGATGGTTERRSS